MAPQATSGMPAPQFRWSPTAEDFTRHQLSHVTNFWRQGRSAEFRLKALPSGQAELCLTFELPSPCESIPPPISPTQFPPTRTPQGSGSGPKPKPAAPKVSSRQRKSFPLPSLGRYDRLLQLVFSACRLIKPMVKEKDPYLTPLQSSLLWLKGFGKTFTLVNMRLTPLRESHSGANHPLR